MIPLIIYTIKSPSDVPQAITPSCQVFEITYIAFFLLFNNNYDVMDEELTSTRARKHENPAKSWLSFNFYRALISSPT